MGLHPADQFFDLLMSLLLPGGRGVLAVVVGFFDESERTGEGRHFCVAGLVMPKPQATKLQKRWRKEIDVPFRALTGEPFHMKRLEALRRKHGAKSIERYEHRAIDIIKDHTSKGVAVLFKRDEVERIFTREWKERYGSLYAILCQLAMAFTGEWADATNYYGPVAYIFESGHKDQGNADKALHSLKATPETMRRYRYFTHAFLGKDVNMPLQAADVWAWNATRHFADDEQGLPMLPSMRRLLGSRPNRFDMRYKVGEDKVRTFFEQTMSQPWMNRRAEKPYTKRIAHLRKRGEIK